MTKATGTDIVGSKIDGQGENNMQGENNEQGKISGRNEVDGKTEVGGKSEIGGKTGSGKGRIAGFWQRHPLTSAVILSILLGILGVTFFWVGNSGGSGGSRAVVYLAGILFVGSLISLFFVLPLVLTAVEISLAIGDCKKWTADREERYRRGRTYDVVLIPLGIIYNALYLSLDGVAFVADWGQRLSNRQVHTPIETQSVPTILVLALTGYLGYLTVNYLVKPGKTPPLVPVLGMAAMYLGTAECILWGIQVYSPNIYLLLLPFNCVIITARTVCHKVREWRRFIGAPPETGAFLKGCNKLLQRSERWPLAAFLLMWPLLGILIVILVLFGQRPDAVIRAFTETADWNLSQRIAPQNVMYDEHYLCTVAAGGHKRVVKPLRLGVRHGHQVIVNRQLCVANAFEQILEERTPGFHRVVRRFYDTYGFPVARLIRSQYAADLVYFLMKPLEWCFLAVLYLTDVDPESRIALQYTGKSLGDFQKAGSFRRSSR
ncbi:MAG: hypothetical protein NC432_12835 [Roseburia sp.]|nr:hypothetical protein [Roseburia sp.]MCM1099562.1 hypothetical protein [Ruminococcus flavefaciens]